MMSTENWGESKVVWVAKELLAIALTTMILVGCQSPKRYDQRIYESFDVQGHRGCRGSLPENSLVGFLQALEWGVTTLEMDVVISKDLQVVVSHEPVMSHIICVDSTGADLDVASHFKYNMFQMSYEEIKSFDCGSKNPPEYPHQQASPGPKPLLHEIIQAVEDRTNKMQLSPVNYNIEIKSKNGFDGVFHPEPEKFVALVLEVIEASGVQDRVTIQSFDPRALKQVREQAPEISTSFLIDNDQQPLFNLVQLGFEPSIYSPAHRLVNDSLIQYMHEKNIAVVPWTVNDTSTMRKLIDMGVDGIITDYPDFLLGLLEDF